MCNNLAAIPFERMGNFQYGIQQNNPLCVFFHHSQH